MDWQLAANVATAFSLLFAVGGLLWQVRSYRSDRNYDKSKYALESALQSFDEALRLLSDNNNVRVTWVSAARIISRGQSIAKGITEHTHKDTLEVHMERYRRAFGDILGFDNPKRGARFFYGADNETSTEEAAKQSTQHVNIADRPSIKNLSESSLWVIYRFAQFPHDYEDPINGRFDFIGPEFQVMWPGLSEYIAHIREFAGISGKLVRRSKDSAA